MNKDRQVRHQKDRQGKDGRDQKRTKEGREGRKEREERSRSRSRERKPKAELVPYGHDDEPLPERTHVSCRRCKELTFSLSTRTCSSCGYPKQTRPSYFPVAKQVQVLDMVRQGKLVHNSYAPVLIQVVANDRFGKRQRIKCCPTDTILQFKKLISAQIGTRPQKIRLQKGNVIYKDHITLDDYQIKDGMGLEMYYD